MAEHCEGCMFLNVRYADPSGYEALCHGRTAKGRMICWQYGLDMDWCHREVLEYVRTHKTPSWCPQKPQKLERCPACGKEVKIEWACGMDARTARAVNHPLGGKAGWYIEFCPGEAVYEFVKRGTFEDQQRAKRKLIRRWNWCAKAAAGLKEAMKNDT